MVEIVRFMGKEVLIWLVYQVIADAKFPVSPAVKITETGDFTSLNSVIFGLNAASQMRTEGDRTVDWMA